MIRTWACPFGFQMLGYLKPVPMTIVCFVSGETATLRTSGHACLFINKLSEKKNYRRYE